MYVANVKLLHFVGNWTKALLIICSKHFRLFMFAAGNVYQSVPQTSPLDILRVVIYFCVMFALS